MLIDFSLAWNTTIHENIPFSAVPMHITVQYYLVLFVVVLDKLFCIVYCWVQNFRRVRPSSIQISARYIAAIVSNNNSIRIEHWYNLEDECVPEQLCLLVVLLEQKLYRTMTHVLCRAFTRMYSWCQKNNLFLFVFRIFFIVLRHEKGRVVIQFCISFFFRFILGFCLLILCLCLSWTGLASGRHAKI